MPSVREDGTHLDSDPNWREEDSPWKAAQVARMGNGVSIVGYDIFSLLVLA